jgi:hypothetical protein
MPSAEDLKKIYTEASAAIQLAYDNSGIQPGATNAPSQLIEKLNQFFIIYEKLGNSQNENNLLGKDNISEIGEQAINCLIDLANWAQQLGLPQEKAILEEIALAATHWIVRHQGEIRSLEPIVNLLAAKANQTSDKEILISLFYVIGEVLDRAAAEFKSDLDKSEPSRPWRMLNFNYAIVATRTMNRDVMEKAFDTLGRNLPEDCPEFFEEGLKQSQKPVYGPEIKNIMAEYLKKWATLH